MLITPPFTVATRTRDQLNEDFELGWGGATNARKILISAAQLHLLTTAIKVLKGELPGTTFTPAQSHHLISLGEMMQEVADHPETALHGLCL